MNAPQPFRPRRAITLAALCSLPLVAGCVLAIGNRVPAEQLDEAGFAIETGSSDSAAAPKAAIAAGKPAAAADSSEAGKKLAALQRELASHRRKLEIAELERENALLAEQRETARLAAELEVARSRLAIFREMTLPSKTRSAELDLAGQQHHFQDAQDELRQLEMLYSGSELEDRTAEIVLARGRRGLQQAQGRLEVAEIDHRRVVERELPLDAGEKERELGKAEFAVAQHQRAMEISAKKAESEFTELRDKIAEAEREIAALSSSRSGPAAGASPAGSSGTSPAGASGSPGSSR